MKIIQRKNYLGAHSSQGRPQTVIVDSRSVQSRFNFYQTYFLSTLTLSQNRYSKNGVSNK